MNGVVSSDNHPFQTVSVTTTGTPLTPKTIYQINKIHSCLMESIDNLETLWKCLPSFNVAALKFIYQDLNCLLAESSRISKAQV